MKKQRLRPVLLVILFLVLNAGGWLWLRSSLVSDRQDTVKIHALLPRGNADDTDRLTLVFDRAVGGPADSGNPPPDRLFDIEPAPAGAWRWASPERLEYVLSSPLPPGRIFAVRPTSSFEALTGWRIDEEERIFRTRRLSLENLTVSVSDVDELDLSFRFNQPVDPDDLERRLSLLDSEDDSVIDPYVLGWQASTVIVARFPRPRGHEIEVVLHGSLAGAGGQRPLGAEERRTVTLPRGFVLMNSDFGGFRTRTSRPDRSTVVLRFTSHLDQSASPPSVEVSPPVEQLDTRWGRRSSILAVDGLFTCGRTYTVTVPAGVVSADGRLLESPQSVVVTIPERSPRVEIPGGRGILSPHGNLTLDLALVNTPRIEVKAWRTHANNLVPRLQRHRRRATTRELASREFNLDIEKNRFSRIGLDLRELLDAPLGLYRIEVSSRDDYWVDDEAVIAVTDLGLTAKRGRDRLTVWVTSLTGGEPVEGVRVQAVTYNNQVISQAESGPDGIADLEIPKGHPDGDPWLVTASRGPDLSFLRLDRNPWVLDDVDQSGREAPGQGDVFLYCERGVYRPGDTIHLTGILRTSTGEIPPSFPLLVRVLRPDGQEIASHPVTLREQGFFHLDIPVAEDAPTGPYSFLASLPGSAKTLGETRTLVEAFLPARIELAAETTRDLYVAGEAPEVRVEARYLFDQPAADLPLTLGFKYRPVAFRSESSAGYRFGAPADDRPESGSEGGLALDGEGRIQREIPPPPENRPGRYRLDVTATVTEPGSRSISRRFGAVVDTTPRHVGIRLPEGGWAPVDTPFPLAFVLRTPGDAPAEPAALEWKLVHIQNDWEYQLVNGRWRFRSVERPQTVSTIQSGAGGSEGTVTLRCPKSGRYRVEIRDPDGGPASRIEFHAAADRGEARTLALSSAERLTIVPDQEAYAAGGTLRFLVQSPFAGTLLATLETTDVVVRKVIPMEAAEATVEIDLPGDLRGGAYLSATVVRKVDPTKEDWRPHRAMGLARIEIRHEAQRLYVEVEAPEEAEPGAEVTISVTALRAPGPTEEGATPAAGAAVHVWAVDEGILQTTDWETPDPHHYFFAPRKAVVATNDLFPDLIPDLVPADEMVKIGGGGPEVFGKNGRRRDLRRNPVPTKRKRAAVVWRTAVPVDEAGRVQLTFPMPDLRGSMRIMAVAALGDAYGETEGRLLLTTPVIVEAGWPRFLAPGDRRDVPVKVFNQTDLDREILLETEFRGPVHLDAGGAPLAVRVPAGETRTVWLDLLAAGMGPAEAVVTARTVDAGPMITAASRGTFPVRSGDPLHTESSFLRLKAGESLDLEVDDAFLPGVRRRLRISSASELELRPALDRLLDYPYGCVEQTTSRLMAIAHAPALLSEGNGERAELAREMIEAGMRRLTFMQTPSGGLSYWPGGIRPHRWGTAYAAEFLVEARAAGHEIPERLKEGILDYLEKELAAPGDGQPGPNERALFCRVLAAFDRGSLGWMARLTEQKKDLDIAGRAHLAAAWMESGRTDRALALLDEETMWIPVSLTTEGRLTSRTRQEAVLLKTLLSLDREHHWIDLLVMRLVKSRKSGAWRSTLEDAAALSALARYRLLIGNRDREPPEFTVEVRCGDDVWTADHQTPCLIDLPDGDEPLRIASTGRGTVFLVIETEGLVKERLAQRYDHGIEVRRSWYTPTGAPFDPEAVRVGDLVRVEVTLALADPADEGRVGNVAIVDPLPGGFEVENPRLATSARLSTQTYSRPDRIEFLDDRVILFAAALGAKRTYAYTIRATGAGSFEVAPLQASCMYEPDLASLSGGGQVEIAR